MTTDLEADLRREFDAAGMPAGLTFHAESVLRQGSRTLRRHRIIAAGSAAMAVGLVAMGATVMTRPDDSVIPPPASHTATSGIFMGQLGFASGTFEASFQLDAGVATKIHYFVTTPEGQRQEVIGSSTGKPGQKPDATWVSGIVDGHPVTIGLVPSSARDVRITFADGGSYGMASAGVDGTDYTVFAVKYPATARRADIQSIRWYGDTGIVDGIGNGRRLTGRVLAINTTVSVEVVLQPEQDGQTTVFGRILVRDETLPAGDSAFDLSAYDLNGASTGSSGAAVVTGRQPLLVKAKDVQLTNDGPPIAAGILPPGSSNIGVDLTTGDAATGLAVEQRLPDGRVIFAMSAGFAHPNDPGKDSIKAVTWTFADGTQGRIPLG
ncbi:MAG: hypothetical protein ABI438_06045 [Dermatophilaceae bacterium]